MRKGYAPLIRLLSLLPATHHDLEAAGFKCDYLRQNLRSLRAAGVICISDIQKRPGSQSRRPVYSMGSVGLKCREGDKAPKPKYFAIMLASVLKQLAVPSSVAEISEATGIGQGEVRDILRAMKAGKLIRVAAWEVRYSVRVAHYELGNAPDAKKPRAFTTKETNARYWAARVAKRKALEVTHALAGNASIFRVAA